MHEGYLSFQYTQANIEKIVSFLHQPRCLSYYKHCMLLKCQYFRDNLNGTHSNLANQPWVATYLRLNNIKVRNAFEYRLKLGRCRYVIQEKSQQNSSSSRNYSERLKTKLAKLKVIYTFSKTTLSLVKPSGIAKAAFPESCTRDWGKFFPEWDGL